MKIRQQILLILAISIASISLAQPVMLPPVNACENQVLTFSADAPIPGFIHAWDFGDGTVDTGAVVTHMYTNPGLYLATLTQTDTNGCETIGMIKVGIRPPVIQSLFSSPPNCRYPTSGWIKIGASSLFGPLEYSIDGGMTFSSSNAFSGLTFGTYQIVVRDTLGCETDTTVNFAGNPVVLVTSPTDPTCSNTMDGSIDLTVMGGTPPFVYSWSNGATTQDLFSLNPGTYSVTVFDAAGCSQTTSVILNTQMVLSGGPDVDRCDAGPCATIGLPNNPAWNYTWFYFDPPGVPVNVGTSAQVCVSPSVTTTYYLVIEDPVTGCRQREDVVVNVLPPTDSLCLSYLKSDAQAGGIAEASNQAAQPAFRVYPNPFRDRMFLEMELPTEVQLHVEVIDLNGRVIRNLHQGMAEAGTLKLAWNGTQDSGMLVASGIYLLRLNINGHEQSARVELIR